MSYPLIQPLSCEHGEWCNGSPPAFEAVSPGSNPGSPVCNKNAAHPGRFPSGTRTNVRVMPWRAPFSESDLSAAIAAVAHLGRDARACWATSPRARTTGPSSAGPKEWGISTDHFDPAAARRLTRRVRAIPLEEVMVEDSTYPRGKLKRRLFATGLKQRECEMCGQGEDWHGRRMALVPRPHQRRVQRPSLGEPADRVRELRRDARHSLRPQHASRAHLCPACGQAVHAEKRCAIATAPESAVGQVNASAARGSRSRDRARSSGHRTSSSKRTSGR